MQPDPSAPARNRLSLETSPYLKQHADNPVRWHPWGEEALAAAQAADKPILLSIGYSACHWCHVMAHESFENPAIAQVMNDLFINIKVDREERPDLDKIYQIAQQMITQRSGGWPLTMFLNPEDQSPFFGGTYFPDVARHGMPAFPDLLRRVAEYFRANREQIRAQKSQIEAAFAQLTPPADGRVVLDDTPLQGLREALAQSFDPTWGGFGRAPKFPHPGSIEQCLRSWHRSSASLTPDLQALYMASLTLTRMAEGGLYDQLAGGFSRYSVDDQWMIPHFEKMLYDNGPLLANFAQASLATGEALFTRIAMETADWILRDMRAPEGGFYSALDADSEGHEGTFYVWDAQAVKALLGSATYPLFARRFGLDLAPNFEQAWHLRICQPLDPLATEFQLSLEEATRSLDGARQTLLRARERRVRPGRDDKILTAWNGLTIKGLAVAARALQRPTLAEAATEAVDFIRTHLWRDGRLLAAYTDGRARFNAYLDDYAFLADALLELLQVRWRSEDLRFLIHLLEVMLAQFEDADQHGFFFTSADHEPLLHRSKSFADDAMASGNGVAASVLCKAGYLLGELRYVDAAERTLMAAWPALQRYPQGHVSLISALEDFLHSNQIVIIRGEAPEAQRWAQQLSRVYAPRRLLFAIPADAPHLPPALASKRAGETTTAYICTGMTCSAPLNELNEVARALQQSAT